ncbi:EAL domain-containing protein [Quatrionicoccus australiensis]|uniref:EAL domain-containing protein n=1 Tax=Quatrionicoccus australiensis TaxID=138118 RepID=UPI001CFA1D3E|nr:EAL domain-containing protein [Quatrionicoccus australiensis]MCB4359902.1 EAL domain-containing protein [Quatrionicoccus australiensis]
MMDQLPREHFPAACTVFGIDEPGDSAYAIESGSVEVLAGPDQQRVAILGVGELFGEVALLDHLPRTATVRTLEPTTLVRIERQHVNELLKRSDPVIRHLLELLLQRFRSKHREHPDEGSAMAGSDDRTCALRTLALTRDLAHALDFDQLELYYQPLISFSRRNLVGFEALVRWRHPTLGMIMPLEFIGLAERTGLIHKLGAWVLQRAVADWAGLRQHCQPDGGLPPFVSVNLSADELGDLSIVDRIRQLLNSHAMRPHELKIELTETVIIEDRNSVSQVLEQLSALGIAIALDDFGTGYAGLETLKSLPISCLKIDKNFVQEIDSSLRSHEIVLTAIQLAASLGISTIAEGIEDEATFRRLDAMGCDVAQGYYFARPMPAAAVAGWLKQSIHEGKCAAAAG